jgi:hypothetical protein
MTVAEGGRRVTSSHRLALISAFHFENEDTSRNNACGRQRESARGLTLQSLSPGSYPKSCLPTEASSMAPPNQNPPLPMVGNTVNP